MNEVVIDDSQREMCAVLVMRTIDPFPKKRTQNRRKKLNKMQR